MNRKLNVCIISLLLVLSLFAFYIFDIPRIADEPIGITPSSSSSSLSSAPPAAEQTLPWNLLLVNPWNPVPDNYQVTLKKLRNNYYVDERIYPDLQKMFDDARAQGIYPLIVSAYRTNDYQNGLYQDKINSYIRQGYSKTDAIKLADGWVARPGYSEHQTGMAVDINAERGAGSSVYDWLAANSYKYGFIVRYPADKVSITGINYEPWHVRYVGKAAAKYMYEHDLVLEEYLEILQAGK